MNQGSDLDRLAPTVVTYTEAQVAKLAGLSIEAFRRATLRGQLRLHRAKGGRHVYHQPDVATFILGLNAGTRS